ncbi:hypothetical protein, partial [Acrocarpospora phusangensis]|uniref:hypothetical protein n=1 Tax=Acrocarpospora phusangensis TaxID=1070424 RepID=UPI0019519DDE
RLPRGFAREPYRMNTPSEAMSSGNVRTVKLASRIAVAGVCFVTLTGCSEQAQPTLATSTRDLVRAGEELLASEPVRSAGQFQISEKADKDSGTACAPGSRQRFFRAQGNFARPGQQSPVTAAGLVRSGLVLLKFDQIVDNLDFFSDDLSVVVMRDPRTAVTFMVAARTTEPNILIVGKTDCFKAEE